MKILLTGATGFIGKKIGLKLVQEGHEIFAVVRNPAKALMELPFPCKAFTWEKFSEQVPDVDVVVHLAGESIATSRWTKAQKKKIITSRLESTAALVRFTNLKKNKPKLFLSASAIGFYGDRGDELLTEESTHGIGFLSEVCESWEKEIFQSNAARTIALRVGVVLGRDGGALQKMLPIFKSGLGAKLGAGKQWMSWIHVNDLVSLISFCVHNDSANGVINAVAPQPENNSSFTKKLCRALTVREFAPVPALALKLLMGEMSTLLLGSQKVSSAKISAMGFTFQYKDLNSAFEKIFGEVEKKRSKYTDEFVAEQWVPNSRTEVFPFFSDANNLGRITPEFLQFKILSQSTKNIQTGTEFEYRLKIHGIPVFWRTIILEWRPNEGFVDQQEKGPYKTWHHTHSFEDLAGGTLLRDRVLYEMPLGYLGYIFTGWKIRKDVSSIFSHRRKIIAELYACKK